MSESRSSDLRAQALAIYGKTHDQLDAIMREGTAPSFDSLLGWEFDGLNVGAIPGLLGIRKFRKGFYKGSARTAFGPEPFIQGYNTPIRSNPIDQPHVAQPSESSPKRFGFYRVHPSALNPEFSRYPNALLLDYGLGANGLDPSRFLRDYLVQVTPENPDILLGKAYLDLGLVHPFAGFFILRRQQQHTFAG
ncbi:MAG: hypothetical protein Q8Q09_11350 [Deltaproteobacteria bacterium]|nr:hypothetical protein [Deltaproteobacteria bacterium]